MDGVVYLVRSPLEGISPFLYSKGDHATVVVIEKTAKSGRIVKTGIGCSWATGAQLSYRDLLELVRDSQRIIAL